MINIGVISPAEIAYRRFLPALLENPNFCYVGVAIYSEKERFGETDVSAEEKKTTMEREYVKGNDFVEKYGGKLFEGYETLIASDEVDALYIPLPPALHFPWAYKALECGKHVLVEKPSTVSLQETVEMIALAKDKGLALHENYMFLYHSQLRKIHDILKSGMIGDVRLFSMKFGFPLREKNDFRYNKEMGGGALLDAGGYVLCLAADMLGEKVYVKCASLNYLEDFEVDMYGAATLEDERGIVAQVAFGMDNDYRCELEVWGSKGSLTTDRIYTAPANHITKAKITTAQGEEEILLGEDNAFSNSLDFFYQCIIHEEVRHKRYKEIRAQAELLNQVICRAKD